MKSGNRFFKDCYTSILELLFPRWCCGCGQRLAVGEQLVCAECQLSLPLESNHHWSYNLRMKQCAEHERLVRIGALTRYRQHNIAANIIHALKYHSNVDAGVWMGQTAVRLLRETGLFDGVDALVPLPLTPRRLHHRGFNQSEIIAHAMGEALGIPVLTDVLRRVIDRESQTHFTWEQRKHNACNVFAAGNLESVRQLQAAKGEAPHLMLVDDVMTTGTTMLGAVEVLEADTVALISCFAWAWVPIKE